MWAGAGFLIAPPVRRVQGAQRWGVAYGVTAVAQPGFATLVEPEKVAAPTCCQEKA